MAATNQSFTPTRGRETEKNEPLGRSRKPLGTYLLTQDKQGQPITEQKGGSHRQKENKKAHLNHSSEISHTKPREGTQVLSGRCTCSYRKLPWAYLDANYAVFWDTRVARVLLSAADTGKTAAVGQGTI